MKEMTIQLSKKKIVLSFFGAILLIALEIWLFQIAETIPRYDPEFIKIVSIIGIIFFAVCGLYLLIKFFDNKPGFIINDEGIIDNSSAMSIGFISWKNITAVDIKEIYGQKILTIKVNNADEILSKQSGFKKFLMKLNKNYYDSPVQISSNILKYDFEELHETLKEQLAAHHQA